MSSHTTYRMRWPARLDRMGCTTAMVPSTTLPLYGATKSGDFGDPRFDDDPGQIAPGITIACLVPTETTEDDATWSVRDGVFAFAGELLNAHVAAYYDDAGRSRERVLLSGLAATCAAPDGQVVGAWTNDSLGCEWMPMVWVDGRLLRGFVDGHGGGRTGDPVVPHDGRLRIDLLDVDGDVVTIPTEAFQEATIIRD